MAIDIFLWTTIGSIAGYSVFVVALIMYYIAPIRGTDAWRFIQARKNRKPVLFLDEGSKWRVTIGKRMERDYIEDDEGNFISISPNSLKWSKGVLVGVGDEYKSMTENPEIAKLLNQAKKEGWDPKKLKDKLGEISKNPEILDPEERKIRIKEIQEDIKKWKKRRGNFLRRKFKPEEEKRAIEIALVELENKLRSLEDIEKHRRFFTLHNFSILRDFVDYGINKTLNALRIRDMTNVKILDVLKGKPPKKERDWFFILFMVILVMIMGVVAFSIATQMLDFTGLQKSITDLTLENARVKADLISCQAKNLTGVVRPV